MGGNVDLVHQRGYGDEDRCESMLYCALDDIIA